MNGATPPEEAAAAPSRNSCRQLAEGPLNRLLAVIGMDFYGTKPWSSKFAMEPLKFLSSKALKPCISATTTLTPMKEWRSQCKKPTCQHAVKLAV